VLSWDITQRIVVITDVSGQHISPIFKCQEIQELLKMGPIRFSETSVSNYLHTLRNIPEERRSHVLCGGRLKSRIDCSSWRHECLFLYAMYDCYWKVRSYRPWLPVRRL